MASDPDVPHLCTADKRERLKRLFVAYFKQLQDGCGNPDCINVYCRSSRFFEHGSATREELFKLAQNHLVKDAFRTPTAIFHFCPSSCFPTPAVHLDVLDESEMPSTEGGNVEEALRGFLTARLTPEAAPWAFLDIKALRGAYNVYTTSEDMEVDATPTFQLPKPDSDDEKLITVPPLGLNLPHIRTQWRKLSTDATSEVFDKFAGHLATAYITDGNLGDTLREEAKTLSTPEEDPKMMRSYLNRFLTWRLVRLFVVLLESPSILQGQALGSILMCITSLRRFIGRYLAAVWRNYSPPHLQELVNAMHSFITLRLMHTQKAYDDQVIAAATVLGILCEANYLGARDGLISHTAFYNEGINQMIIIRGDFDRWGHWMQMRQNEGHQPQNPKMIENRDLRKLCLEVTRMERDNTDMKVHFDKEGFSYFQHSYLLDAGFKHAFLQLHSQVQQQKEAQASYLSGLINGAQVSEGTLFLVLNIDREDIIHSALTELSKKKEKVRKRLRIKFMGEEGIDEGGVKKEFFLLVIKQLFDPGYGMFTEHPETLVNWFQPRIVCDHNDLEFNLIGQMIGLAIYNNVILDINFPLVVYKKLLNIKPEFADLKQLDPELFHGLCKLLSFDEEKEGATVEDTFQRTFTVTHHVYGEDREVELKPGGASIPLTNDNKYEYVQLYTNYITNECLGKNFTEFYNGFHHVCIGQRDILARVLPEELESMVVGNPELNLADIEEVTKYDGFTPDDEVIKWLWEIIREMTGEEQRAFLKFCTGTDRVPIRGIKTLGFVIGRNGGDSEMLPTAHTCFNHLLLPAYVSKEKFKEKLFKAISNCTGFGLM